MTDYLTPPVSVAGSPAHHPGSIDAGMNPFAFPRETDEAVREARITIVDDEPAAARIIRRQLLDAGFSSCNCVTDSKNAIEQIFEAEPDLVLLDVKMKPTNGLDILQAIRHSERTKNTPVIVVSAANDEITEVTALNLGATDFVSKPVRVSELVARTRNTLSSKIYRDLATARSAQLESDLLSDALTGIANRRAFEYELKRRMMEWNRQRTPLGLIMIDIDRFKRVNDRYGHLVGDKVLHAIAQAITSATRSMDLVARYGGEELAVILPATTFNETKEVAERIRAAIYDRVLSFEELTLHVTISAGAASAISGEGADVFMRRADAALYAAKNNGRNCSFCHDGTACVPISKSQNRVCMTARDVEATEHLKLDALEKATIAIVDDEPSTVAMVRKYLHQRGFRNFINVTDALQAIEILTTAEPDLVMLDIHMPGLSGLEILRQLRAEVRTSRVPVLVLTSDSKSEAKMSALSLGANDFLQKPCDPCELVARVKNTLRGKAHMDQLEEYSRRLEYEVRFRTAELSSSRREAIQCLARAAELRDDHTGQHVIRVGRYAAILAEELGFSEDRVLWMEHAAQLHDVGKIGMPDSILNKQGALSASEFELMKAHCVDGTRVMGSDDELHNGNQTHTHLAMDVFDDCNSPIMRMAALVAHTHHEKWDGTGYPRGLAGKEIPIEGRVTAVADVFDALSTQRPYKAAIDLEECFQIISANSATHFDPDVVAAFFARKAEIIRTFQDFADLETVGRRTVQ